MIVALALLHNIAPDMPLPATAQPAAPPLPPAGQLLLGVVRIHARQVAYLLHDCNDALAKIKLVFRWGGGWQVVRPRARDLHTETQPPPCACFLVAAAASQALQPIHGISLLQRRGVPASHLCLLGGGSDRRGCWRPAGRAAWTWSPPLAWLP